MNALFDDALVGAVLLVSALYACVSLGPRTLRRRVLAALVALTGAAPVFLRLGRVTRRLRAAADSKAAGACGGCDNCGSEKSGAGPKTAGASAAAGPNEINVPLAKIGRRTDSHRQAGNG